MRFIALLLVMVSTACGQRSDLRSAFADVRKGNFEAVARLNVTVKDVPALSGLLRDSNEDVQREAVVLLQRIGGAGSCVGLVTALTSASEDVRERTARAIHSACPGAVTNRIPNLETALRQSVQRGNSAAAAVLLLGRFQDGPNREFLKGLLASDTPVKSESWNTPVPQAIAAAMAGASAGVAEARPKLVDALRDLAQAEFLASALGDLTDPAGLQSLLPLLDDRQPIRAGVPSGAQPQRRLCDLAVDSFVMRLGLKPSFNLNPGGRYTSEQIAEVRKLAAAQIARN